jgi:DNA-binding transcriptional ArsR family regulator
MARRNRTLSSVFTDTRALVSVRASTRESTQSESMMAYSSPASGHRDLLPRPVCPLRPATARKVMFYPSGAAAEQNGAVPPMPTADSAALQAPTDGDSMSAAPPDSACVADRQCEMLRRRPKLPLRSRAIITEWLPDQTSRALVRLWATLHVRHPDIPHEWHALTASELARVAGIAAATASGHLGQLLDGGLVAVEKQGRYRYYRLAGPDVASAIEALMNLAKSERPGVAPSTSPVTTILPASVVCSCSCG